MTGDVVTDSTRTWRPSTTSRALHLVRASTSSTLSRRFGRALAAIADADGTVVVHCMGGKDRTGLVSALLLRLAGVGLETIGEDYSHSADNLAPLSEQWLAEAADEAEREKRRRLAHTPAGAMVSVVEEIERRYGDVASYLRAAGLTDAQIDRLRERLVDS